MNIGKRIKQTREKLGLTADDLAAALNVDRSTVYRYESSYIEKLPTKVLEPLAKILRTTPAYLMGWEDESDTTLSSQVHTTAIRIPVLGKVVAGIPIEAIEDILDYEDITPEMAASGEFFALKITGKSMEPKFSEGDVVLVRQQSDVDNGDIAIVLINGDAATVKKVKKTPEGVTLIPLNPAFDVLFLSNAEIESLPVTIIGKVIELRAKF